MTLLYLILGHLLADFVLQPDALIAWKHRSWKGSAVHAFIHLLVTVMLFLPFFSWRMVMVVSLIGGSHFLIDLQKVVHEKKAQKFVELFLFDQLFHAIILAMGAVLIGSVMPVFSMNELLKIYFNPLAITYLNFAVVCTFVVEIFHFQKLRAINTANELKLNYRHVLLRLLVFSIIYGVVVLILSYS